MERPFIDNGGRPRSWADLGFAVGRRVARRMPTVDRDMREDAARHGLACVFEMRHRFTMEGGYLHFERLRDAGDESPRRYIAERSKERDRERPSDLLQEEEAPETEAPEYLRGECRPLRAYPRVVGMATARRAGRICTGPVPNAHGARARARDFAAGSSPTASGTFRRLHDGRGSCRISWWNRRKIRLGTLMRRFGWVYYVQRRRCLYPFSSVGVQSLPQGGGSVFKAFSVECGSTLPHLEEVPTGPSTRGCFEVPRNRISRQVPITTCLRVRSSPVLRRADSGRGSGQNARHGKAPYHKPKETNRRSVGRKSPVSTRFREEKTGRVMGSFAPYEKISRRRKAGERPLRGSYP